jgi:hypothetical protein
MTKQIVNSLIQKLEISSKEYKKAESIANSLASHIANCDAIKDRGPELYIQGSFKLGTVVKPIDSTQKFDIDIVCVLTSDSKDNITKDELKKVIGDALKTHPILGSKFKPKSRCWCAEIDEQFKVDVVPAIVDRDSHNGGILIQDKYETRWQHTNPKAYFKWFDERRKMLLVAKNNVQDGIDMSNLEDDIKMPLQVAVQILKRMRDYHFRNNQDFKPSSIILTTIAATYYNGEPDVLNALNSIISKMPLYDKGEIDISYNGENFADQLNGEDSESRRKAFIGFLKEVKELWPRICDAKYIEDAKIPMSLGFGTEMAKSVLDNADMGLDKKVIVNPQKVLLGSQDKLAKPWLSHL